MFDVFTCFVRCDFFAAKQTHFPHLKNIIFGRTAPDDMMTKIEKLVMQTQFPPLKIDVLRHKTIISPIQTTMAKVWKPSFQQPPFQDHSENAFERFFVFVC